MKTQRIWFGCASGLALSMLFGWSYGFFAIMLPLFILSRTDSFQLSRLLMVVFSAVWTTVQATFLLEYLQFHPVLMTVAVGLLVGSIVLNFASYDFIDIEDFNLNLWVISLANIAICALAFWLFPEPKRDEIQDAMTTPVKSDMDYISQVAMGWVVAMAAFLLFQFADLYDSLSAQASIIIMLTPMTLAGSMAMAKIRVIGTALGCLAGLAVQLVLGGWYSNGLLFWLALTIAMGPFCYLLTKGPIKGAIAFSAMSALAVPLTAIVPEGKDAFFSILYRFSSIFVAVTATAMLMWVVHHGIRALLLKHPEIQNV
ncbi:major facilitator superfamily permease [Vibrio vulnificus]|uniref:DUF2955 domain-containing protein n=1 Tax=Vibrio vulnificus TaxID=672 RepID=UPI0007355D51|nr:DUF2955 domain-containing protein [Vibrio vulnificus]PNN05436.1 DUF2955 domain-containing protein [Vibrio vulnificus]SUQ29215.1 major facilitator superfamily permease [Vibrio vulnificus]HAS8220473.1 DUF2955 domain-containing protein [Vibrio vulnificus]HAS8275040.1 DUF2955 domain-containing protein [Vibrio vulnificus]